MPVFFSRTKIDVDVVHAFFALEKGFLLDRFGIAFFVGRTDLFGNNI